jgi:hypothetical protein
VGARSQNTLGIWGLDWRTEAPNSGAGSSGLASKYWPLPLRRMAGSGDAVIFTRRLTVLLGSDQAFVSYLAVVVPGIATRQVLRRRPAETPDQLAQRAGEDPASTSQS